MKDYKLLTPGPLTTTALIIVHGMMTIKKLL